MTDSDDEMRRLIAVIDRQRDERDRLRAAAVGESIVAMATGVLMERLGLSSAGAASQLAELSAATGVPLAEMAAAVLSPGWTGSDEVPGVTPDGAAGAPEADSSHVRPCSPVIEAAAELAADGAEVAGTLAGEVLAPFGASAVVLWLLEADGALALLGESGLPGGEASRWRHVPPQLDCPAQRVAHGGTDLWWPTGHTEGEGQAGQPAGPGLPGRAGLPVIGRPDGARAVLALRERNGSLLAVMEVIWPGPLPEFGAEVRQHLSALAAGCAQVISARLAHGSLAAAQPKAAVYTLLDSLADSVLVVRAVRDSSGRVNDFAIDHVSPGFRDPAGNTRTDLAGMTLLEAYPASVRGQGLFARGAQVLADGVPQHVPGPLACGLAAGESRPHGLQAGVALADLRVAKFFDGVIFTWHGGDPAGRTPQLAALLGHAQRLGRLGGWEEDLVTGAVRWTDTAFELFGLVPRQGTEIPLSELHSYVIAADKPAVKQFRQQLPERREAATATFRVVHPHDRSIHQIRVFAEPVIEPGGTAVALRGAFQDISAHYRTQVALAAARDQLADTEQRVAEEHLLALRLQQAIMPPDEVPAGAAGIDIAVRYRPAGEGHLVGGDWYDTLLLPSNDVLLVVGDVAGHGIDAVTGMVAARNSLRGLAITGAGPAELLRMLNGVFCHLTPGGVIGTVVCGLYRPQTRMLRWARAGHLPPVLIREPNPATARALPMPGGVLLGMDPDAGYEEATQSLDLGDTLLLFTDGLIEQRGESIEEVLGKFIATLTAQGRRCGRRELTAAARADQVLASTVSDTDDDACLVVVRIR